MSSPKSRTIAIEEAMERLRQEQVTFEQRKLQDERWFTLRLRTGYTAVVVLPTIAVLCGWIVLKAADYPAAAVTAASATLFGDVLGLLIAVWKVVLNPSSGSKLAPVTVPNKVPSRTT